MEDRFIRIPEAVIITGRSKSSLLRDEDRGTFPKRKRIGKYAVGYKLSEIQAWLDSRPEVN